ncbi:MAG: hypothetical protein MSS56_01460, partial [Spirochaetia bacterium]|nr:hypothetical protein [Spirochaetia bacterium]
ILKISCFSSSQKKWCAWQSIQCAIALAGNKGLHPQSKPPAEPVVLILHVTFRQAGSLSVVEVTLRQLDYMHDDVTGSLSAVEVCLYFQHA